MGHWGNQPFQSDFALDMRDKIVDEHAIQIESSLRNGGEGLMDLQEFQITLASASILAGVTSRCGNNSFCTGDVDNWEENSKDYFTRLRAEGEESAEDIDESESVILELLNELRTNVAESDPDFQATYRNWLERRRNGRDG